MGCPPLTMNPSGAAPVWRPMLVQVGARSAFMTFCAPAGIPHCCAHCAVQLRDSEGNAAAKSNSTTAGSSVLRSGLGAGAPASTGRAS